MAERRPFSPSVKSTNVRVRIDTTDEAECRYFSDDSRARLRLFVTSSMSIVQFDAAHSFFAEQSASYFEGPLNATHHAVDAELVSGELCDERPCVNVPHADGGQVAAFARDEVSPVLREAQTCDGFARRIGDVSLAVFARVV